MLESTIDRDRPIRLRVYDIDGTLANTEHLSDGRRVPADLLAGCAMNEYFGSWGYLNPPHPEQDPSFALPRFTRAGFNMANVPGVDVVSGIPVALITRSPRPYASTLAGLLGLERYPIWASSRVSRTDKLKSLARMFGVAPAEIVYVGDSSEDRQAADAAGCAFESLDSVIRPTLGEPLYEDWWPDRHPLTEVDLADPSHLTTVSGIVFSLRSHPHHHRTLLQARLARLVRPEHRYCLIPAGRSSDDVFDFPGVPAYLFSNLEHDETYLQFLRNVFPARHSPASKSGSGDLHYFVRFRNAHQAGQSGADPLGRLMSEIKDYRTRAGRVRSGPDVQFGGLRLVADVMAAHLVDWFRGFTPPVIDYVPPHEFSFEQPGQTSWWLARWVAEACQAATGNEWRMSSPEETDLSGSVLIDDHRTTGSHIEEVLNQTGERIATLTWSWSKAEHPTGPLPSRRRRDSDCFWPDPGACPMHDGLDPAFGRPPSPTTVGSDDVPF